MKKGKLKIPASFIFVILLLNSCGNIEKKKQISKIDKLEVIVQQMQDELFNSKMDSIIIAFGDVSKTLSSLNKNSTGMISDTTFIKLFEKYTKIKKQLKSLNKQLNILVGNIQYSKSQLSNLKKDILEKSIKVEQIREYLEGEQMAVDEIKEKFKPALEKIEKRMKSYHEMRPVMKKIEKKLKNEKK